MDNQKEQFLPPELTVEELSHALYKVNKELEMTNKELIQMQKEQFELFANISHDLRSPITAIRASVDYLRSIENPEPATIATSLELIHARTEFLETLINDIFLLSTVESIDNPLNLTRINIGMFLEEFFYNYKEDKKYEKSNLELDLPVHFPYEVNIDCHFIQRALDNLFSNALKYSSQEGTITLSAKAIDKESIIEIIVSDTGCGIAKEHLSRIFDRAYMINYARTPGHNSGSGFGLTIAKSIIEHHNGSIWCESELHKGSRFFIHLPCIS